MGTTFQRVEGRETKMEREKRWQRAVLVADAAGQVAADACQPVGMVVGTPRNMMASLTGGDDGGFRSDRPVYVVEGGVCGFAWVTFYPERGGESRRFVNWLLGRTKTRVKPPVSAAPGYQSPCDMRVRAYGQSMQRKTAYAQAFAAKMREAGVPGLRVYAQERMD